MKKTIIIIIILLQAAITKAQNNNNQLNPEQTMQAVQILISFDEQFDNGAPESLKKAKFNEFVNQLYPEMSTEDREKAYKVVNWYIKASKAQKTSINTNADWQKQMEAMINEADDKKEQGMQALNVQIQKLKNMSYSEYKSYVTNNGEIYLPENEIQQAYNQMHKNDGKQVPVTPVDKTKITNPIQAIEIIEHPEKHTYNEFKSAMRFLSPDISDEEIKHTWDKLKKNNQ